MRKTEKMTNLKSNKGITLIALVITIIVLLILAGVAISMLSGENGILTQAAEAKTEYEAAQKQEEAQILDLEVLTDFSVKNTPYNFSNGYLTGLVMEGTTVAESVEEVETKLPSEYNICNIDGSSIENKSIKVQPGMILKKGDKSVGLIILVGDYNVDGIISGEDLGALNYTFSKGIDKATEKYDLKEYSLVAADINADGIINWIDLELLLTYIDTDKKSAINQNVNAKKFEKVVVENTSRKEYVNDSNLKAKFDWQEGSTTRDGYYNYSAESTDTVKDILDALPNKKTIILRGEDKLNETDTIAEGDIIMLIEEVRGVEVSLDIAKITK